MYNELKKIASCQLLFTCKRVVAELSRTFSGSGRRSNALVQGGDEAMLDDTSYYSIIADDATSSGVPERCLAQQST